MNQQLQTKAMALLTALLQGASPTERKVSVLSGDWMGVGTGTGAGSHCAPSWDCRMGVHGGVKSPKPPSHLSQHMLDYLWQRNLRQFIYKVGRTGLGSPLPTFPPPWKPTLTLMDWFFSRISSIAQHHWVTRWLTICMYFRPLHWGCWSHACGRHWTPTAQWVPLGYTRLG